MERWTGFEKSPVAPTPTANPQGDDEPSDNYRYSRQRSASGEDQFRATYSSSSSSESNLNTEKLRYGVSEKPESEEALMKVR